MVSTSKTIYEKTSITTGIPFEVVKFIGDTVFSRTDVMLRNPPSLITKIRGLGFFFIRKKKMERFINMQEAYKYNVSGKKELLVPILKDRLKDYELFLEKKRRIKQIRHENQKLIQPSIQEEDI